jgi:hypothetical protein
MSYLRCLCLLAHSGVQHILCCVLPCFSSSCVPLVPVSLDSPFLTDPSVFLNVYFNDRKIIWFNCRE